MQSVWCCNSSHFYWHLVGNSPCLVISACQVHVANDIKNGSQDHTINNNILHCCSWTVWKSVNAIQIVSSLCNEWFFIKQAVIQCVANNFILWIIFSVIKLRFARQFPLWHTNLMEYTVAGSTIWIFFSSYHWKKLICNLMLLILSIQLVTVFLTSLGLNFNMHQCC